MNPRRVLESVIKSHVICDDRVFTKNIGEYLVYSKFSRILLRIVGKRLICLS